MPTQTYDAALAADDWDTAEEAMRRDWADSGDERALALLVNLLLKRGRPEDAETVLAPAAEKTQSPALIDQLARVQYHRKAFGACEKTLERLIALAPDQPLETYQLLVKVKFAEGRMEEGRAIMAEAAAARPQATDFAAAYADMLPAKDAVAALEKHLAAVRGDPARMAYIMLRISTHRAPAIRTDRSLPAEHGISWPDTYQWPDHETLPKLKNVAQTQITLGSPLPTPRLTLAFIALAEGDWERAERYLADVRDGPKRTDADFIAFGAAFHAGLDAMGTEDILGGLVPVQRILSPPPQAAETVFISSDRVYFERFTLPFVRQLDEQGLPLDLHIHILDGTGNDWAEVRRHLADLAAVRATLTAEASGAAARGQIYARNYYHAVRYIRFFEELQRIRRPMWIFDADVRLQRDPRALLASLAHYDLALRTNPCAFGPTLKITATCAGMSPTEKGLAFARRVAAYITHWKNKSTWGWGVDQAALFSSYAHMSAAGRTPHTLFLDNDAMNDKVGDTGTIRFLSGIEKYTPGSEL